jgi:hypothetical protein
MSRPACEEIAARTRSAHRVIADLDLCHTLFEPGFNRHSQLFGAHERPADILVFRTGIERNQPIAVLAVRLKPVADILGPLSEYLRAFRAFDFHFFVDHEMPLKSDAAL